MKRSLVTLLSSIFFAGCTLFGIRTVEEPHYTVLREDGDIQIREYDGVVVAETAVEGEYKEAGERAFRRLANYIFGENRRGEKIPMTAPVFEEQEAGEKIPMTAPVLQEKEGNTWKMSFVLPARYTIDSVPQPLDSNVMLKEVEGKKVAALSYSGSLSEEGIEKHTRRLREWLEEEGYAAVSGARSAGYDPPWTIPFFRRNEVHIDIE